MTGVLADPVEESGRILAAAETASVPLRAVGGVAVALRAPSVARLSPPRAYHDLDFAAAPPSSPISELFAGLGYEPAKRFNTLNGAERLLFHDPGGRRVDVFIDVLRMCHDLPLADRLLVDRWTIPLADLVLSKLQIVELTDRDAQDLAALLADHPLTDDDGDGISSRRLVAVCGDDWGWWRTVDTNLEALATRWRASASGAAEVEREVLERAAGQADLLRETLAAAPKSLRWRVRAAVGPRIAWYSLPEEVR